MLEKIRTALVESFAGAIAIGWLLAEAIVNFAGVFAVPVSDWLTRRQYRDFSNGFRDTSFHIQSAYPQLIRFGLLAAASLLLLRWLYMRAESTAMQSGSGDVEQGEVPA